MAPARKRRTPLPRRSPTSDAGASFIREQAAALAYTAQWHRVYAWAERAVSYPGFDVHELAPRPRVAGFQSWRVSVRRDAEEAYERGIPLEALGNFPGGPRRDLGGYRRVTINAYTWKADEEGEVGYDPAWITLGWGMTAHEAGAAAHRFVRHSYDPERYQLIVTGLEVKFWTQAQASDDV